MRILQLHVDFVEYLPVKKEIDFAEPLSKIEKERFENCVVILISIEKGDDESLIEDFIKETLEYLKKIQCNSVLIYPYAHLSSTLEPPKSAFNILVQLENTLRERSDTIVVRRAPFGWTKELGIKVKGHPLAENSRLIVKKIPEKQAGSVVEIAPSKADVHESEGIFSNALSAENDLKSRWYVLNIDGSLVPYNDYKFKKSEINLENLFKYEILRKRTVEDQPPHVKLMRKLGVADYEPASDSGNMRFYPKGRLLKSLLEQFVTKKVSQYGGLEVETPIMYDSHHPSMESYFNRFPARQYNIKSDQKDLFLRFAACFGQFLMTKDFQISYKNLPLKLYELTRYSFRREKSGELVGLRRLRAFSMPDCHAFCQDIDQAKIEFLKRLDLSISVMEEIGISINKDLEMAIRFTSEFYTNNKEFVQHLVTKIGKPVLVEMWDDRFFYFVLKWEFNFLDNSGKASALSTDQIDIENGERYGITFIDESGNKKNPIILHNSPSGAIERVIFALLEKSARMMKEGKTPYLPNWLMNTQVRIIPVRDEFIPSCIKLLEQLKIHFIRADIDDREDTLSKKIRDAETEWIHYIIIIGEKEVTTNSISVRDRLKKVSHSIEVEELIDMIKEQIEGKPALPINLPEYLSKRPKIAS